MSSKSRPLFLRGAFLCDGTRDPAPGTLAIADGRIAHVLPADAPVPDGHAVVDATGLLVTPGLIDVHTHLFLSGELSKPMAYERELLRDSLQLRTLRGAANARTALAHGFTPVRDVCTEGAGYADVALRAAVTAGYCEGPRVVPSGPGIGITGGYVPVGVAPGVCFPTGCTVCDGPDAARREVRTQVSHGVSWIKVFADWACSDPHGHRPSVRPTFTRPELEAIVDEAARRGRRVAAHATSDAGARQAIDCGVASIEHVGPFTQETFELAAARGVFVVPTLSVLDHATELPDGPARDHARRRFEAAVTGFRAAIKANVRIACGTDIGCFPHERGARRELLLYMTHGMSPLAALRTATGDAAALLELDGVGRLERGAEAELCGWAIEGGRERGEVVDLQAALSNAPVFVTRAGGWPVAPQRWRDVTHE